MKRKLQVFVSSTFNDLIEERQAAVAAILKAGHIPAGMELFTAGDRSQLETIKKWIDESDAYMLILGGRYGSIEPGSGVSYTELEYDYAQQQGKSLFTVVIKEDALEEKVKRCGTSVIEQNDPRALKLFRDKVLSNVSSFFADEKDIKLCVHESLADLRDNQSVVGWVSAADVEDTKPLHEEIARLRNEIDRRQSQAARVLKSRTASTASMPSQRVDELIQILRDTEVNIPESLVDGKIGVKNDLLSVLLGNSHHLLNGVTNAYNIGEGEQFLYFSVCPKLMVHGLADNEKVVGVRYRRSFITDKGESFLSQIEERNKKAKSEESSISKPTNESERPKRGKVRKKAG